MALKGNLRDFTITQLLNLINLARKTGTLVVEGPSEKILVSFREGKLAYAQAGQEDNSLVTILYKANKLTAAQHKALKERAGKMSDKELGLLLDQCQLHQPARYPHQPANSLCQYRQPLVHLGGRPVPLRERSAAAQMIKSPSDQPGKYHYRRLAPACESGNSSRMKSPTWIWRSNSPNDPAPISAIST